MKVLGDKIKTMEFQADVLSSQVSKILSEAILEGVLEGGQKLVEMEIQEMFGISRSPLREAIRDLEKKRSRYDHSKKRRICQAGNCQRHRGYFPGSRESGGVGRRIGPPEHQS